MNWLTHSWWTLLGTPVAPMALTVAAILSGGIIGSERERHEKAAGMRTIILVCLGASIFTMAGFAFTSTTGDSGRVAAQIVTGIGFLGAGVILHERHNVSGMTTAATIWVTAAIGLTIGAGYALAGFALALIVRVILTGLQWYERRFLDEMTGLRLKVSFRPDHGKTHARIARMLTDYKAGKAVWSLGDANQCTCEVALWLPKRPLRQLIEEIANCEHVLEVEEEAVSRRSPSTK